MTASHKKRHKKEWSLTGAARAAREARIATVRHLQDAPIARVWHVGKLQRVSVPARHRRAPGAATALVYGGLGYRPPWPADWPAATENQWYPGLGRHKAVYHGPYLPPLP